MNEGMNVECVTTQSAPRIILFREDFGISLTIKALTHFVGDKIIY
jgi:hypothetical protein